MEGGQESTKGEMASSAWSLFCRKRVLSPRVAPYPYVLRSFKRLETLHGIQAQKLRDTRYCQSGFGGGTIDKKNTVVVMKERPYSNASPSNTGLFPTLRYCSYRQKDAKSPVPIIHPLLILLIR